MPTDNEWLRLTYLKLANTTLPQTATTSSPASFTLPSQGIIFALNGRSRVSIAVTVSSINTSVGIGLRAALVSGGTFYPLSADGSAVQTLTANGDYLYTWEGSADSIEVKFESESGGTSAQIDVLIRAQ